MYQPLHPHIPEPPTKKLKLLAVFSFATMAVLVLLVLVVSLQLITQYHRANEQSQKSNTIATALVNTTDQLTVVKRQLIIQSLLPDLGSFTSQCPDGNEKDGLFTPLSKTPIESYNVFLVDCRSNISTGKSLPRILVFHVDDNGKKEFTYGASANEPLCISNKIPVANKLAVSLSLPVCQTN